VEIGLGVFLVFPTTRTRAPSTTRPTSSYKGRPYLSIGNLGFLSPLAFGVSSRYRAYVKASKPLRRKGLKRAGPLRRANVARRAKRRKRYEAYLRSPQWRVLRLACFEAAGWRCNRCEEPLTLRSGHAHHKTYARFGHEDLEEDLEALCRSCHRLHHALRDGYKWRK